MPDKAQGAIVDLPKQGGVGSISIGVTHVIDDGDGEWLFGASHRSGLEGEDIGLGGAVAGGDLIVVGLGASEVLDLHIVEVLTALRGRDQ